MSIRVYILSKLMEDNNYPYNLKKELSEPIPLDQLGGLTESKLYYHFEALAKKGLIEPVKVIKEEHRPDKQVYTITTKGREEFPKKIYKVLENSNSITDMIVGLANLEYVNRDKVVEILEQKVKNLTIKEAQLKELAKHVKPPKDKQTLVEFVDSYVSDEIEHTICQLKKLIKLIQQKKI